MAPKTAPRRSAQPTAHADSNAGSTGDRYMSVEKACRRLNKWRQAVQLLMIDGALEYEMVDGRNLLLRASVEAYAARHGIAAPQASDNTP